MIDVKATRQPYDRRELAEVRWINGQDNPAHAMTKGIPNKPLENFIDTNQLIVRVEGWSRREKIQGEDAQILLSFHLYLSQILHNIWRQN